MKATPLQMEQVDAGVVALTVATDEAPYLDPSFAARLSAAVDELSGNASVRVAVLVGGARYFSAGASRESLLQTRADEGITSYVVQVPRDLLSLPVPTVAAMAGHANGGGLALGLGCDIALLAEESLYGVNFVALGFTPGMGSTLLLEEAVGAPLAREMLFTGRLVKGREIKRTGGPLAHAIVPRAEVHERALSIAREIAEAPRETVLLLKQSLAARRRERLDQALAEESANHARLFAADETRQQIAQRYHASAGGAGGKESSP